MKTKTTAQLQAAFFESVFDRNSSNYPSDMSLPAFAGALDQYVDRCVGVDEAFNVPADSSVRRMYRAYRAERLAHADRTRTAHGAYVADDFPTPADQENRTAAGVLLAAIDAYLLAPEDGLLLHDVVQQLHRVSHDLYVAYDLGAEAAQ